jgi:hypothetical protein
MFIDSIKKVVETYSNVYFPDINKLKLKKEKFNEYEDQDVYEDESYSYTIIMAIISWLVTGLAVYLSFQCSNGFSLGPFLLALFFSPFYIIYHLFATKLCGLI